MTEVPTITLNDGNKMPQVGLGVLESQDHDKGTNSRNGFGKRISNDRYC